MDRGNGKALPPYTNLTSRSSNSSSVNNCDYLTSFDLPAARFTRPSASPAENEYPSLSTSLSVFGFLAI
jgi:hypothetical protein